MVYGELDGVSGGKIITDSVHLCVRLYGREKSSVTVRTECS